MDLDDVFVQAAALRHPSTDVDHPTDVCIWSQFEQGKTAEPDDEYEYEEGRNVCPLLRSVSLHALRGGWAVVVHRGAVAAI